MSMAELNPHQAKQVPSHFQGRFQIKLYKKFFIQVFVNFRKPTNPFRASSTPKASPRKLAQDVVSEHYQLTGRRLYPKLALQR